MKATFARAVLLAQKIHEESMKAYFNGGRSMNWEGTSYYRLGYSEAATKATTELGLDSEWAHVIYLLNYTVWKDIQDWAKQNKL